MTTRSLPETIGRRLGVTGIALAICAAIVGALLLSSPSSSAQAATPSAATSSDDRDALRQDLKDARELPADERREALADVREKAADGGYGDTFADRMERRADRRSAFAAFLPDALVADLDKVRDADPDERAELLDEIRKQALAGDYGDEAKEAAEIMQEHWDEDRRPMRDGLRKGMGGAKGGLFS